MGVVDGVPGRSESGLFRLVLRPFRRGIGWSWSNSETGGVQAMLVIETHTNFFGGKCRKDHIEKWMRVGVGMRYRVEDEDGGCWSFVLSFILVDYRTRVSMNGNLLLLVIGLKVHTFGR